MHEISVVPLPLEGAASCLDAARSDAFYDAMRRASKTLAGRTVWHVNSTGDGGGVAEMLRALLPYVASAGIDVRWMVIDASDDFFAVTKRIHHMLHGADADGSELTDDDRRLYEEAIRANRDGWKPEPNDVVILHDPQVVGLAPDLEESGCCSIWSCHIGADEPNDVVRKAWSFLLPYAERTRAQTFSRESYVWEGLDSCVAIIPPCIDPSSPKNQELESGTVSAILDASGLVANGTSGRPRFLRQDGSEGEIANAATLDQDEPIPREEPVVVQVSRWDPLKDPVGVLNGFVGHVPDAHLVLAGPAVDSVEDDPESAEVFSEVVAAWKGLPPRTRARAHLARLPMSDLDENAAIVNALQRRADVVVQKSLAEGFGLTVAEAMWKGRPTVGGRVGGIQDQIVDGESGRLVDPTDLAEFGAAVAELVSDPEHASRLGEAGRQRVLDEYLAPRYLSRTLGLIGKVIG